MKKVFVIGDSISIQYGPHLEKYLQGVMRYARKTGEKEALQNLDKGQGANGGDSSRVLAYLESGAEPACLNADFLLVNCGLHDIKTDPVTGAKQVSIENYRRNVKKIIAVAAGMKPQLVWIRTTPCDEKIHNVRSKAFHRFSADQQAYNQAADKIMTKAGIPMIDLYTFTVNLGPDLYRDHVHFHDPIREKQGAFIAGWLSATACK